MNTRAQPDAGRTGHGPPAWLVSAGGRGAPLTAKQDRDRAALAHLSLAFGVLGPLVVWLLYRDRGPFTSQESREALNFSGPPTLITLLFFFLSCCRWSARSSRSSARSRGPPWRSTA